jgi:hypothetical protein
MAVGLKIKKDILVVGGWVVNRGWVSLKGDGSEVGSEWWLPTVWVKGAS